MNQSLLGVTAHPRVLGDDSPLVIQVQCLLPSTPIAPSAVASIATAAGSTATTAAVAATTVVVVSRCFVFLTLYVGRLSSSCRRHRCCQSSRRTAEPVNEFETPVGWGSLSHVG